GAAAQAQATLASPASPIVRPADASGYVPPALPATARRKVKLRVLGNPEMAAYLLRGGPGILDVEMIAGIIHVGYTGTDTKIAEIVHHLVKNNIGVIGVEQERNELERIFLEVTRGEVQ